VRRPCPHPTFRACRSGHQDYCYTGDFRERGIKEAHGYLTEFVVDQEQHMTLVSPDLRDIAVLTEPLTIAEKAFGQIFWMMGGGMTNQAALEIHLDGVDHEGPHHPLHGA
jgi:hypothetical protein